VCGCYVRRLLGFFLDGDVVGSGGELDQWAIIEKVGTPGNKPTKSPPS
jgi:hypothetical protein